ncbi:MAG: amidohydrolase [Flavobacteriales bacterium]
MKKIIKQGTLLLAMCLSGFVISCKSQKNNDKQAVADKVFINGKIYTADTAKPMAEAMAIKGNKIVAVGSTEQISKLVTKETKTIDLKEHLVIPGLNDAHFHSFSNAPVGHQIQLPWEPSWSQVLEAVEKAIKEVPEGTWITGLAGVNVIDDLKADRFSLDKIAPNHPVYISTWFSHGEIINTKAMNLFGIDERIKDPLGGWFIRVENSDVITGKFHEYAQWPLRRQLINFNLNDKQLVDAMQAQTNELIQNGVTSIQDMPILDPDRYLKVLEDSKIPIRVRYMRMPNTSPTSRDIEESKNLPEYPLKNLHVRATGTKWFLDGTPMERVAATRKAYADSDNPNWKGKMSFTNNEIKRILTKEEDWRGQVLLHTHGDRSAEIIINTMESIKGVDWKSKRVRMEHGDGVVEDLIPRAADLGAVIVQQPHHLVLGDIIESRFGHKHFFKFKSLLDANIPLAFGTEGIESPFAAFVYALNHPFDSKESLTREEVIDGFTKGAAFAEFEEKVKGQIKVGMLADIAILSQDILTVPEEKIVETKSIMTIVDGKIVYDSKALTTSM